MVAFAQHAENQQAGSQHADQAEKEKDR
jgi:hypothetical protein